MRGLLTDPDVDGPHRAIAAAAALEDREAIPALIAAAETPDSRFEAGAGPGRAARPPRACRSTSAA